MSENLFSEDVLRTLADRALTIEERVQFQADYSEPKVSDFANIRFSKWKRWAANGDKELFQHRLDVDSLSEQTARWITGARTPTKKGECDESEGQAQWTKNFAWIAEALGDSTDLTEFTMFQNGTDQYPFQHFFQGLIVEASRRANLGDARAHLSISAVKSLQRSLLRRLTHIASSVLYQEFTLFKMFHGAVIGLGKSTDDEKQISTVLYSAFISELRKGGLCNFFKQRPVLARLITTLTQNWIESTQEFLHRLKADCALIAMTFNRGQSLSAVTCIETDKSDSHVGGRTVWHVTFQGGLSIGYKPRSIDVDLAWYHLLLWLDEHDAPAGCSAALALPRDKYGWVQWIQSEPCRNAEEIQDFFCRAGVMLCLIQFLGGTDFHHENVIAVGPIPCPIDLETLLQPWLPNTSLLCSTTNVNAGIALRLRDSVFATDYLPAWTVRPDGVLVRTGGLDPNNLIEYKRLTFRDVNTDQMVPFNSQINSSTQRNLPSCNGRQYEVSEFCEQLQQGYRLMYEFLIKHGPKLLAPVGPLAEFKGKKVRVVLKSTSVYNLLRNQFAPEVLSSGFDWSVHFEYLTRWYALDGFEKNENKTIQKAEKTCLANCDIPYFSVVSDSRDLVCSNGSVIADYFVASGFDQLSRRWSQMSEESLVRQLGYIHLACHDDEKREFITKGDQEKHTPAPSRPLLESELIPFAAGIAELLQTETYVADGCAAWLGASRFSNDSKARIDILGHNLYYGGSGIGLFFSALFSATQQSSYKALAMAAFHAIREDMRDERRFIRSMGLGGASGLGSIIYSLVRAAAMLEEPQYLEDASNIAAMITDERIEGDCYYDVATGSAGAIMGLLALHGADPGSHALARAAACGYHLVRNQVNCPSTGHGWKGFGGEPLTGMSHGTAGIALALLRLSEACGELEFAASARGGIAFERSTFSSESQGWPDLRVTSHERPAFPCLWCHGAVGIGLARLASMKWSDDSTLQDEVEIALNIAMRHRILGNDGLCCGNFGMVEFFLVAGRQLDRSDLISRAHSLASGRLKTAAERGNFVWSLGSDRHNPSFFTGIAGIGYQLIRLARPADFPCVLIWE